MMIRSYLIYLLLFQTIVYADDEILIKRNRIKRLGPTNTTLYNNVTATSATPPTSNVSLTYIITSYTSRATSMQTSQWINQTSPAVTATSMTTRARTTPNIVSPYNPDTCQNFGYIKLLNGTCATKLDAQIISANLLRNTTINVNDSMYALSLYISSITNSTTLTNKSDTLSVDEIDNLMDSFNNINQTLSSNTSFMTIQYPQHDDNTIVLGALFIRGIGGEIIDTSNENNITKSFISAAAMFSPASLSGVLSLNLLIIDKPTGYETADNITNKTLASSVIVASLRRNTSTYNIVTIYLYFNPIEEYKRSGNGIYLCSFYDTNSFEWAESGCSGAYYNSLYNRYECNCTHLTSFALIWLPQSLTSSTNYTQSFDAQDIASLIFQGISILCFLAIMTHAIIIRLVDPSQRVQTLKLLPLISTGSTTILFIFFIALGVTVYFQTSSANQMECFLSSSVLMFFTYFFLIFMFCIKTSAGYFYYLRFVRLFPHPSHRQLFIMILISTAISIICVLLAIGFNTNSNYNITQLYPYKLCWFTRDVIYYFLTIPIGVFLLLNIITITLVSRSIITHAFHATTRGQINERLKRCVIVLLSSCVTQGIGWLFGPFISFLNPIAGNILSWFFIILNGLEGFWSIVLYLLIRLQHLDEQKHITTAIKFSKSISSNEDKKFEHADEHRGNSVRPIDERFYSLNDLRKRETDISNDDRVFH